jgi:DNA-binding LacI/PurR family transcriptional regulator
MKEFKDHGIRVPEDVSIVGIDDIAINSHLSTSLSSVHTHNDIASKMAVDILMKKIDNQYYKEREEIIIKSEFIARESTSTVPTTKGSANKT